MSAALLQFVAAQMGFGLEEKVEADEKENSHFVCCAVPCFMLCSASFANGAGDKVLAAIGDQNVTQKGLDTSFQKPQGVQKSL